MSGRHESWQVRRWAPTALNAVVALVPAGAMLSAVGAAGTGYLMHRPDIAAAGAGTAAVGLAVERMQNRSLRIRARRERWEWRAEREQLRESLDELRRDLEDAHHTLNVLRSRIHTLHERSAETPRPALTELAVRQRLARQAAQDDAPTMPLRRIGQPAAAGQPSANPLHGNPFLPSPFRPVQAQPAQAQPVPIVPGQVQPAPVMPGRVRPERAVPAAGRPTPAEPERRRPLVTLARLQAVPGTDGWRPFEPVRPQIPADLRAPAPAAMSPVAEAPAAMSPVAEAPAAEAPAAIGPVAGEPVAGGAAPVAGLAGGSGTGRFPGTGRGPVTGPITLGPLAQPPHLPVLPAGPGEPVHPAAGLSMLPPGPRDPVSGPLAIIVDLAEASRASTPRPSATLPSATLPADAVDAMVYAAIDQAGADELTVTLERLDDPDRGGRHAGSGQVEDGVQPSGLVVVGASVVGDPQARARRGRHSA